MIPEAIIQWPKTIEFGAGRIVSLASHLEKEKRIFVLSDPFAMPRFAPQLETLRSNGHVIESSTEVQPEPPFEILEKLIDKVEAFRPHAVVGIGGGSTMDLAKLASVLFTREQTVHEILGIGKIKNRTAKLIAIATTSGTGSEATPIAVLTDTKNKLKKGVVSPFLIPDVAIVDAELTLSVPPAVTASTGMDAMTHCLEAYTNVHAHPIIDNIALAGIRLIGANIVRAVENGNDIEARTAMSLGSLYGGMCLGPVNTAAVHAMAYPLGGEFHVPHGVANSLLLPYVMRFNLPVCIEKYTIVAEALGLPAEKIRKVAAEAAVVKIKDISDACGIPPNLRSLNIPESALPRMAEAAIQVTRLMQNNPRTVGAEEALKIYTDAY